MKVILRRTESLGGLPIVTDEQINADRVTLGRGTDQDVQLPDMRVTLAHAEIRPQGKGWRIECKSDNPVWVNGHPVTSGMLALHDAMNIGRFRVHLRQPPPGTDLLLEIEEHLSARQVEAARKARVSVSLAGSGLRKRRWAWALAAVIGLVLFALPIGLRYGPSGADGPSLDRAWQAGPPSSSHSGFIEDCSTCHETPFVAVRNETCLTCHRQTAHHSDRPDLLQESGMTDSRCGSCHLEHSGRNTLVARNTALCTACHADPAKRFPGTDLQAVDSFDRNHPGFTLSLPAWTDDGATRAEFAQEPGPLREETNLAFPHDVHLKVEGLASPEGKRVLACVDCHRPLGTTFEPIRMETHCQSCHRLDFDPDKPGRRLPHRAPDEVAAIVLDHYARMALTGGVEDATAPPVVRLLRRPGQVLQESERRVALDWANARAARTLEDVFTRRLCSTCHQVVQTGVAAQPYDVEMVMLTAKYLTGASFDHSAHRTEDCSRCHAATSSKSSTDVMVPPLATCRECHGDPGTRGRMATACVDCHGFHIAEKTFFGAPAPVEPPP